MKITSYELIDHGLDNSQYFQGCGVAFTKFENVQTGCGLDALDALSDCIDQICQVHDIDDDSLDEIEAQAKEELKESTAEAGGLDEDSEEYYYVSIRYNVA